MSFVSNLPVVLTIAGFDPSGSAGTIADVRTLTSLGCRPVAAITSLTFQNSAGVFGAIHESADSLRAQILPIAQEFSIDALKIGMLPTRDMVAGVIRLLTEVNLPPPVIDPVMRSSSGYALVEADAVDLLVDELLPMARVITPNIPEAENMTGLRIVDEAGMREAARSLRNIGARAVLLKGGHLKPGSDNVIDLLDDGGEVVALREKWIAGPTLRGTGCVMSSAIAAHLSQGRGLEDSVRLARQFVSEAIRAARPENLAAQTDFI